MREIGRFINFLNSNSNKKFLRLKNTLYILYIVIFLIQTIVLKRINPVNNDMNNIFNTKIADQKRYALKTLFSSVRSSNANLAIFNSQILLQLVKNFSENFICSTVRVK